MRPFNEDDEAAHEHVSEHLGKLGERQLQEGDFSYEDITGKDDPPVDSPLAPGDSTVSKPPGPSGEGPMEVGPDARRRKKLELSVPLARQETAGDHDDMRRRVDELEAPISSIAQHEAPILNPVSFDLETRNDEIAVDVPLPEEPAEICGDHNQG